MRGLDLGGGVMMWDKTTAGARPQLGWLWQHSEFIVFGRKGNPSDAADARNTGVTLPAYFQERAPNAAGGRWHLTEKPVGLMRHLCMLVRDGGRVLDPFVGSGTTLEACRQLGLAGYGIELEADYCARIKDRLAQAELLTYARKPKAKPQAKQEGLFAEPQDVDDDPQKIA